MPNAQTIEALRNMPTEQLIAEHDATAKNTVVGTNHYLEELARRDNSELSAQMLELTKQMRNLTLVILALTVVNVIIVLVSLFVS